MVRPALSPGSSLVCSLSDKAMGGYSRNTDLCARDPTQKKRDVGFILPITNANSGETTFKYCHILLYETREALEYYLEHTHTLLLLCFTKQDILRAYRNAQANKNEMPSQTYHNTLICILPQERKERIKEKNNHHFPSQTLTKNT